jgi:hypothetical protein
MIVLAETLILLLVPVTLILSLSFDVRNDKKYIFN